MKNKFLLAGLATVGAMAWAAKDPVVMTVNGVDVPQSEFEYLYNKNSQQQLSPQPLDEYVEMFKLYKLKVADARAEGIDTLSSFRKEMEQYRHDLAAPYMTDSVYLNQLVKETYDRSQEEVEAKHIMLMKSRDMKENAKSLAVLDSLRKEILGGASFSNIARSYSQDRTALKNGGNLGFITVGNFPYFFEKAVFETPEGKVSEIVESPVGYHLIEGGRRRPARGTVLASHIMKMTAKGGPEAKEEAKRVIDSLYNVVKQNPDRFEEIAIRYSDDKNSGRQGGLLPWFGAGEMVAEFDSAAFALAKGEISEPVQSQYGWHIIKKINEKPVPALSEIKNLQITRMTNPQDERYNLIKANQTAKLGKKHHLKMNDKNLALLKNSVSEVGLDSAFFEKWNVQTAGMGLFSIDGKQYSVADFLTKLANVKQPDPMAAEKIFQNYLDNYLNRSLVTAEEESLLVTEPDYRNLMKEYEDGSLLYEVSKEKVWDKAAKDQEGLVEYFNNHRDDYKWKEPRVKGILVQAVNDSVADLIKNRLPQLGNDSIIISIRKEFGGNVQIERVLVQEGTNPMVDYLMFGGKPAKPAIANFTEFFLYDARLIDAPEEVFDVRGLVTSDYQNEFQTIWEEDLKSRYPVVVNEKVLGKLRKKYN